MATVKDRQEIEGKVFTSTLQDVNAPGATDPMQLRGDIGVQINGAATSIDAVVERSVKDPSENAWSPAEDDHFTGSVANGIAPREYHEPVRAWWRVRVIAITGAAAIHVIGEAA